MTKLKWWGYLHVNGTIQAKRFFDDRDIQDARESDFVARVHGPFEAEDRNFALLVLDTQFSTPVSEKDELEPDWSKECDVCGATPIVPLTGMCGPCSFGEAETIGGNW